MNTEGQETGTAQEQPQIDPSVIQRYEEQYAEQQRRIQTLAAENDLRRLREMRLYEEQEARNNQPVEEDLNIDPEAKKVLDKVLAKAMAPVNREVAALRNQLAQAQAGQQALTNVELIRRGAPFIDQISGDIMKEIKSLPPDEQVSLSNSPNTIIKMAHMIWNQKGGRAGTAKNTAAQMAATESGGASPTVIPSGNGPWWREKGYSNLNAEERQRADADIARLRGR